MSLGNLGSMRLVVMRRTGECIGSMKYEYQADSVQRGTVMCSTQPLKLLMMASAMYYSRSAPRYILPL